MHEWNFDDVEDTEEVKQLKDANAKHVLYIAQLLTDLDQVAQDRDMFLKAIKEAPHTDDCAIEILNMCYCFDHNDHHPKCVFVNPPKCTCWKKEYENL